MTGNILRTLLLTGLMTGFMAGCSGDDEHIFEHGPAGPNTEKALDSLPEGLQPDRTKASHTSETLEPKE